MAVKENGKVSIKTSLFRMKSFHFLVAILVSAYVGWSSAFIFINIHELCYIGDYGPHGELWDSEY